MHPYSNLFVSIYSSSTPLYSPLFQPSDHRSPTAHQHIHIMFLFRAVFIIGFVSVAFVAQGTCLLVASTLV